MATPEKRLWPPALLFTAGATNRLTRVDEGNTVTDFDEEEVQRKITISTAIAAAEWNKKQDQPDRHARVQHLSSMTPEAR